MEYPKKITAIQTAIIIASSITGTGLMTIAREVTEEVDTLAPLLTSTGILIAFLPIWVLSHLGNKYKGKTLFQYSEDIIGKWPARLINTLLIAFFAVAAGFTAREFGAVVRTSVLRETPLEIIVVAILVLVAISCRNNITTFAYIHHFYFPIVFMPVLIITIASLQHSNVLYLQPVLGNNPTNHIKAILLVTAMFQFSFVLTVIMPAMRESRQALKAATWGLALSAGLYLIIVIATLSVFGSEEIKNLIWPTLELTRITTLPGEILQRLDAAYLAVWVTAVYTSLFSSYFIIVYGLKQVCRLKDHKLFSFFILPMVFLISAIPRNVTEVYSFAEYLAITGLFFTIIYPSLLLAIFLIKKTIGKQDHGRSTSSHG
ncbi:GerAB/ArcD/ProY family transporter [Halalkalibacter krulwichiae]|uniref:Spore germination protein YndE n=1 Tax=Halalkalibacter krulwichiae TaxID=199441 RepID=A0A1X9MBU8_9BACI|nr:endospore germination permease [Halalkalibacter krulwichiae]ARK30925.1 Spore germination protein YndE [Halalkalibacter krulwichiae]